MSDNFDIVDGSSGDPVVIRATDNGSALIPHHIIENQGLGNYETVAASQTDQVLGATGASGDWLDGLLIVPESTSPGAVSIKDGAGSSVTVFAGGASSVSNLVPFFIPVLAQSGSGAWSVTTGTNVHVFATGRFT